eukprot:g7177.t1
MFQSAYQDGECVEVFSPAGKNPGSEWKSSGKIVRVYEKGVKGYVLTVSGGATSKMQLPKAPKGLLGLRQRHLVLQVLTAASQDKPFSLELGLKDSGGTRRRLVLSSSFKALHCTPLHAQVPLVGLDRHRGTWANLSIDLVGLTAVCFKSNSFSSLELISIGPTCRLRKIFTMRDALDDWEDAGEEGQEERVGGAAAPGPNEGGGCEAARMAPMPARMAFPAGVVPTPRNWVISVYALRRLASRDVPPRSPSKRTSQAAASSSAGRTRRSRQVPSPSQSSFSHGSPSLPSATASLGGPGEERSVLSSRSGAKERGTARPRLLEEVAGKPSSSSSSRASPTGLLPRQRSISSRGSNSSSTRPPATPSPLATPARNSSNTPGRRDPRPLSSYSGLLGSSTPGSGIARDGVGVGLTGREEGDTTPSARRSGSAGAPSLRRTPPRAETVTPGSDERSVGPSAEESYGGMERSGRRGVLPARRRAAEAYLSGGITNKMGQTRIVADDGGGGASDLDGQRNRAPTGEWRLAGGWGEANDGVAPAWSFLEDNGSDRFGPDDVSRKATPKPTRSNSVESPLGPPQTELGTTTAPARSSGRPAVSSIVGGATHGAAAGPEGDDLRGGRALAGMLSSTPQASHEALPADIDVSWREGQYGDDGGAVTSTKRFSSTVRLRSPGAGDDAKRLSSHTSPPYDHTIPSSAAGGTHTALGASGGSSPDEAFLRRKEAGARAEKPTTSAHLFASTFSALGDGNQAAHRSPAAALDGGASRTGGRSPMSARVDVLQNLLAPAETDEQDLTHPNVGVGVSATTMGSRSEETVPNTPQAPGAEEKGGVGGGAPEPDDTADHAERPPGRRGDNESQNTNDASGRLVDAMARHERSHPGLLNEGSDHQQQAGATEHLQTPETRITDFRPTGARPRPGFVTGTSALDRGPAKETAPLGSTDQFDATERIQFNYSTGLSRPSSYSTGNEEWSDERKPGARPVISDRSDELEELERKEIALLDLEESSHSEFGSVELSQSPEKRAYFTGNDSPGARDSSAAAKNPQNDSSTTRVRASSSSSSRYSIGHGPSFGSLDCRQRASVGCVGNDGGDSDSVVLGSRASTASAAPGEGAAEEEPNGRAGPAAEGGGEVDKREVRDRGGGVERDPEGANSELYFDPVLNCYYDKVADKYYGLR